MVSYYRALTALIAPLMPLWLHWRKTKGKEDPRRIRERFGFASQPRPEGMLLWLHAASVGEAMSVLHLMAKIRERFPYLRLLLTTGTVTSAKLMQQRLPKDVIHQYIPIDTPEAVRRFMRHWKPDVALWVESELWPNLVLTAHRYQCFMGIVNGRMSPQSFRSWKRSPSLIRSILSCFNIVFAQSEDDAERFRTLGAKDPYFVGNLKYDASLLPCDESVLLSLRQAIGKRPLWLAASTHPGEEETIAKAHVLLVAKYPKLLTLIVPRHPERGGEITTLLKKTGRVARRSRGEPISADIAFYVADTLGELGLFYRLSEIVFMGGSLIPHGGQNPLEPARLACGILTGPHTLNFAHIYWDMEEIGACRRVADASTLATQTDILLSDPDALAFMQDKVREWMQSKTGASDRILDMLEPVFKP